MQVTETHSEGLKRTFQVSLAASELEDRLNTELSGMKDKVQLKGFRPGKVPVAHLRKVYGRSVMADVVQNAVNEANQKIVADNGLKLALEPQIEFPSDQSVVEKALDAKADLSFKVALEVLPSFELADLSDVSLTKLVATPSDTEVNEALERMAGQSRPFTERDAGAAAETGDRLTIDFVGRIDGTEFEGGKGEGIDLELGSNSFIPGFEEALVGAKVGEQRLVKATFPEAYGAEQLAGKDAEFDVTVTKIQAPGEAKIDDDFAKGMGLDSLDALKEAVAKAIGTDFEAASRRKLKKELLDALDGRYAFDLPPSLVAQEFASVWAQVEQDLKARGKTFEDEDTTEEKATAEYRKIAERRVRLGLVLAQVGESADIKVSDEEVNQALIARVRQFPGQEQQVWDFYRKNAQALAELRAPLFEEKVVDHVLGQVKLVEEPVSKETLFADEEADDAGDGKADAKSADSTSAEAAPAESKAD
ncbi:trigger factor [Methylobacterium sp. E-041]|jgi:trigger factor|uniref:trigger factor n=1 Tax=unclassified Methylobacterium TaxID=2615210 RepID=UPI0011C9B646|nr:MULTISPECIES: trigger factor [unclassified Methylobacterium]MCJ2038390.1 trigger factor [Methylobacterium sp. J-059]MCJ2108646.1 trigger factor [Methylobacterium sp. E-041]MCJ2114316.1 trigger factor [Methylobacterium sp. E-025]TXM91784.1 trigger factor [Methylobacterium sp. WL116]TXN27900.1 trigger factor [Methylobacterium sp. WL93]